MLGTEQFGNMYGVRFVCPINATHKGEGYCVYSGQWSAGLFHGIGQFKCCDGRVYRGEWTRGQRHGKVRNHI